MSISRVQYREQQRLTAADLRAEQDYRLALGGRHHVAHHEWGVVRGLRVIGNVNGGFTLTRGAAIDGYGRELVVTQAVDLEVEDLDQCSYVHIAYCEDAEQVPPGRPCQDDPAPRIGQRVVALITRHIVAAPLTASDPGGARAAGARSVWRPWPVLVAAVGLSCSDDEDPDAPLVDYARVRYVRHRAGLMRSPNGRAQMQLGLAGLLDVYHFLLSTAEGPGTLARRVGIDRDRVTHIWQPLVVSGADVAGQIVLPQNRVLRITAPKPGGIGARLRVNGQIDLAKSVVSASFLRLGDPLAHQQPSVEGVATIKAYKPVTHVPILAGRGELGTISLVDRDRTTPVPFPRPQRRANPEGLEQTPSSGALAQSFSDELRPTGGELRLCSLQRTGQSTAVDCGDVTRTRAESGEAGTPVVQFRPALEIAGDPLAREIHAVTTSKPTDPVPRTELRISGGAEDESDASSRLSIGSWLPPVDDAPPEWIPALRMDGGRRLEILVPSGNPTTDVVLEVDDTVYLPPIGKKDPLLPDLMAMAFIAGLRQIGRVPGGDPVLTMDLDDVEPNPIVRGGTLTYQFQASWGEGDEVNRCLEVITGIEGNGDMTFRTLTGVSAQDTTFDVTVPDFRHRATKVRLEIQMLVTTDNVKRIASVSVEVPVTS